MEHGGDEKQIGVDRQTLSLARERGPIIDAHRVLKYQFALGAPNHLRSVAGNFAVRNLHARDGIGRDRGDGSSAKRACCRLTGVRR